MQRLGKRNKKSDFSLIEGKGYSITEAMRGMHKENISKTGRQICRPEKTSGLFVNKRYTVLLKEANKNEKRK